MRLGKSNLINVVSNLEDNFINILQRRLALEISTILYYMTICFYKSNPTLANLGSFGSSQMKIKVEVDRVVVVT